jgi:hypothetical protein
MVSSDFVIPAQEQAMKSVPVRVVTKSGCITVPEGSAKLSIQEGCYRLDLVQGQVGYSLLQSGILPLQLL